MPKISVIVPVYKVEQYLDRCVESIIAQTFTDFELILVDDGSPDNCPAICDEWAEKDKRIRVIHKKNEGVAIARNVASISSKGKYITFIDSDDWVSPEYLQVLYDLVIKYDADISVARIFKQDGSYSNTIYVDDNRKAVERYGMLNNETFRGPMAKLILKNIVINNPFPIGRAYAEDMAVVYKWYFDAKKVVGIEQGLYYYFINTEGATFKPYGLHRLGNLQTLHEILCFTKKHNFEKVFRRVTDEYLYQLTWQYNELLKLGKVEIAKKLKKEVKKTLITNSSITLSNHKQYYEFAYPKTMYVYWTCKGIVNKLSRFFGAK